ncbi:Family of serine hydrolases 3 [Spathaspora sp. JA1]|nr:Family of serine hydrolases 3 [Spathaspora sp. JA1]
MTTKTFKGKIIFLHGYTQSSTLFYAKTSGLRKKLAKLGYKSVYINGPYILTPSQLPTTDSLSKFGSSSADDVIYRAWWLKHDQTNDGINLDESITAIRNYIDKGELVNDEGEVSVDVDELPIVGIIGFSQGAALAGLLAYKFNELFGVSSVKFVVLYSGFKLNTEKKSGNEKYDSYYPKESAVQDIKYLHVYGELDTVVEESRVLRLYELTKNSSELLKHPGGHFVPNSKIYIDQVTNWIESVEQEKEEKPVDKHEDIATLMELMDSFGTV